MICSPRRRKAAPARPGGRPRAARPRPWTAGPARLCIVALLVLGAAACAPVADRRGPAGPAPSPKLGPFIHFEEGDLLFIGVDARAAQYVKDGTVFPVGLGLANRSRDSLTFSRESFTLEADDGTRYPLVSHQEFLRDYKRSRVDERLANSFVDALRGRYINYAFRPWRLFPFSGEASAASDRIELGRRHWTRTYLYFPVPPTGIHGRQFVLIVRPDDVAESMIVRFNVR